MTKIPEKFFDLFCSIGIQKSYCKDEIIYFQNDSADFLYLVLSGRVRVYTLASSGKETTLEIIEKGRIFGESSFLSEHIRPTTVAAVNQVLLVSCSIQDLIPVLSNSTELMTLIFQHLSETCNHLSRQIHRLTNYDRYQKISSFLLEETLIPNQDKGIEQNMLPYTHEEIAETLGMNRVTVSKVLSHFAKQNLIQSKYGKIVILDRESLKKIEQQSIECSI
ncbi:Crp/Fnr family transcriptional regulator [Roseburia hominis]